MDNIISQCNAFLVKSDSRYANTIKRAVNDLRRYSGDFWNKETVTQYKRNKRTNLSLNNWNPMVNAIASPISNSPWHVELTDNNMSDIQQSIDNIESDSDTKSAIIDAFRKAVLTGYGYLVATTIEDELTGEPKIIVESASHIDAIAVDHRWITRPYFRNCSRCLSYSKAHLYPYARHTIANRVECTFGLLRYNLGGNRPSQTDPLTRSPDRIHGHRLDI